MAELPELNFGTKQSALPDLDFSDQLPDLSFGEPVVDVKEPEIAPVDVTQLYPFQKKAKELKPGESIQYDARSIPDPINETIAKTIDTIGPKLKDPYGSLSKPYTEKDYPDPVERAEANRRREKYLEGWTPEKEMEFARKHPNIAATRYAAMKTLLPQSILPGMTWLTSPEDWEEFKKKSTEDQQREILGETIGWEIGMLAGKYAPKVIDKTVKYVSEKIPLLNKINWDTDLGKWIKDSQWFRELTIRERGLVVQTLDEVVKQSQKGGATTRNLIASLKRQADQGDDTARLAYDKLMKQEGIETGRFGEAKKVEADLQARLTPERRAEILWKEVENLPEANQRARQVFIKERLGVDVGPKFGPDKPYLKPPPEPFYYEGDGYKVTEAVKSDDPKKARWKIDLEPDYQTSLSGLLDQVKSGEPGGRIKVGEGPEQEWQGYASTYPDFMRNRFNAKETITALEKASQGADLGPRQAEIVESALEYVNEQKYLQEKEDLINDGIERTEIERIEREAKEEFTRETEAEFAELERRAIQEQDTDAQGVIDEWSDFFAKVRGEVPPPMGEVPEVKFMGYQDPLMTGEPQPVFEITSSPDPAKWKEGSTLTLRRLEEQGITPPEIPRTGEELPELNFEEEKPKTQPKKVTPPSGSGVTYADTGGYATNVKSILQLPEITQLAKELSGGKYPRIKKVLRKASYRGTFSPTRGEIDLLASIFKDPAQAAAVMAHEVGHLVDWLPDKTMSRGNILGRIASLKKHLKHTLPEKPGAKGELTTKERSRLRYLAKKLAEKESPIWIDEVITKELPVTPEDVLAIWNDVERAKLINPELYDYVARLSTPEKKSIVKEAMKGVTPEQLKTFAKTVIEKTGKRIRQKMYKEVEGKKKPEEWFAAKIRERYAKLINEEIKKRKLFHKDEIMDELKVLSRTWKPFDPSADANYTKYRYSSPELYADAFSALLNAPGLLKAHAPKYYEAFFNYLEKKPEVKKLYEGIQDSIKSGEHKTERVKRLRKMIRENDDAYGQALEKKTRKISDMAKRDLIDANHMIIKKLRTLGERNVPAGDNPRYPLEEMAYSGSEAELYMNNIFNQVLKPIEKENLTWEDLGEYLYHLRVVNERSEMANPQGWTSEISAERIQEIKTSLGSKKFAALEDARKAFRKIREELFIKKAEDAGIYNQELMNKIKDNEFYATFEVAKYLEQKYGRAVGAKIFKQIGTLDEITNPATATIMKDISLIKSINRNNAAKGVTDFLKKYYPEDIEPAERRWNGRFQAIAEPTTGSEQGLITYLDNGQAKGYYVDKWIADIFDVNPYESQFIAKVLKHTVQPFRLVFTELNYGFWLFNIWRDYIRAGKLLPDATLSNFFPYYMKGLKPAFKSVYGIPDEVIKEMQKGNMLISIADVRGLRPEDTQLERMLAMYRITPGKWEKGIRKPIGKMFNYFTNIGRALERTTKVASYKYLLDKFPEMDAAEAGHIIRTQGGSPDFLRLGRGYPIYNNLLMFSNAMKEGYRGDYESFSRDPAQFMWKQAKYTWIPKLIMKAAEIGLLGAGIKAIYDGVSEYDKTNYLIIPLGLTESGKSVYIRLPQDETGRFLGGILWKAISGNTEELTTGLFDYMAGQAPTVNPSIEMLASAVEYASGQNPYDHFRGRNAIPEQIFEAGGKRKHEAFLKWMAGKSGAGLVYRFKYDDVDQVKTELEKVLGYPISSNILGRFIKVGNVGIREDIRKEKEKIRSENARELLDAKDALNKMLRGEDLNNKEQAALLNKPDVLDRNAIVGLARKYGRVYMEELMTAQSNKEKVAVLNKLYERQLLLKGDKNETKK